MKPNQPITRLAPSPTGALHLGNVRTFLINHAHAVQQNAHVILRVEDLDTPRVKPGADLGAVELLRWLGIQWDQGPIYQTSDLTVYQNAIDQLARQQDAYPCSLSRKQIEQQALSAPHADEHETRYPGLSRHRVGETMPPLGQPSSDNIRLVVPDETTQYVDCFAGEQTLNTQAHVGDFLIATKAGYPAYQLAVVIDDANQGVTDIVRGDDLLPSTHRQIWLQRKLKLPTPQYWHVPLVIGEDGKRLAKRHGDTRLATYRKLGATPEMIIGLIAYWSGLQPTREHMTLQRFTELFEWEKLPRQPIVFSFEDHRWLLQFA